MEKQEGLWLFHLESPARPMGLEDRWQLCLPVTGWGRVNSSALAATLSRGQLLLTPPGSPPELEFEAGSQWYQLFLDSGLMETAAEEIPLELPREPALLQVTQEGQQRLELLFGLLAQEESSQGSHTRRAREYLLGLILIGVGRAEDARRHPAGGGDLIPMVLDYIEAHYGEPISLDHLAGIFYVSKYYLSHLFSQKTGISLFRYLQQKRLMEARQLLAQGVSPSEACQRCGFGDYANFYRAFKQQFGQPPRAFSGRETGR